MAKDKNITGIEHTHAKSKPKKQIMVYYFSPESLENTEWEGKFEDIPLEKLLDEFKYSMFTIEEFLNAFNMEEISDLGLVRYVNDYDEPKELKRESMIVILDHSCDEVDILSNFPNTEDSVAIEEYLVDRDYKLQNISWMKAKNIKFNFINY